jgi:hypothetical protein
MSPQETREAESRWALPVAVATFLAAILLVVSTFASTISGTEKAEVLESIHEHSGSVTTFGLMQALALALLVFPIAYLFRAARARSERVRPQLIGLVIAAPLFLAVSAGLTIGVQKEAADQFLAGEAKSTLSQKEAHEECASEQKEEGGKKFAEESEPRRGETPLAACERQKRENDQATNALTEASLASLVTGLAIAGSLGFVIVLFYACLWGMRTGLLTRFWGSLGMASGIAFLLGPLSIVAIIWFVYFGLMILGLARPPAWEAGEAIPWPTPGEKAAAELEPGEAGEPVEAEAPAEAGGPGQKRKRKQRE